MSGRTKRGPGRPRNSETMQQTLSPYPSSPLTPESDEGFIISTRDEGRSPRVRHRPKLQPAKKTRVNAQSKLKSPIKSALIGSCIGSSGENHDLSSDHSSLMEVSPYSIALENSGQPLYDQLMMESFVPIKRPPDPGDELAKNKMCAFCNCGVEKSMFHGKLQRYAPTAGFNPYKKLQNRRQNIGSDLLRDRLDFDPSDPGHCAEDHPEPQPIVTRRGPGRPPGRGRRKGIVVVGLPLRTNNHEVIVDKITYGTVREKDIEEVFDEEGYIWAHHCCAAWSEGVCQTDSYDLINVDKAVVNAISERCSHCNRFGASVACQVPRCGKIYHYPCAASSGSFQDIKSMTMLCPNHLEDAGRLAASEAECVLCGIARDFAEMIFCTSCGRHYHGRCLEPAVDLTSLVRMGWQCPDCKVCQGCRQPGDDNRMLVCDLCDTGYHTYCLDPPMTTIPKTGWKCLGCRRCEDCGSNTPGGGPTSRWHHNFSVCDSCYQQRNKGLFCPLCGKAYRQFTDVAMVQCLLCEKWIHASCDNIDKDDYQKLNSKELPYYCPTCRQRKGCFPLLGKNHCELGFDERLSDVDMTLNHPIEEDKRTLTMAGRMSPCNDLPLFNSHLDKDLDDLNPLRQFDSVLADVTDTETIPMPNLDNIEAEKLPLSEKLPLDEKIEVVMKPDHEMDHMLSTPTSLTDSCSLPPFSVANQVMDRQLTVPKLTMPNLFPPRNSFMTPPKIYGKRKMTGKMRSRASGTPARKKSKHGKPGRPPSKLKNKGVQQASPGKENLASAANMISQVSKEEESESLHTTLVLFSADDEFTTKQDMCLCCGSFGKGSEGQLIMCSQCGQSYHPYCVGVKVNKVILTKGWRCLDCTLCEGCGKGSDEARLLLCDSCDISYHTYCLDPPLDHVPQGGWKCRWCVTCFDCAATTPGIGCEWMSNYTQCGPCASKITCPVCRIKYNTNDLMIQCAHCDRWLHGSCDGLMSEEELDHAVDHGYHCLYCRPVTKRTLIGVSGPPSPKATALHHYHPQFSKDNSVCQPPGKPLHPCQRVNNNLVELKLSSHFNKMQMTAPPQADSVQLTETGVLHMNRLKLPSGSSRKRIVKSKIKPKKFGSPVSPIKRNSFASQLQEKDAIFASALIEGTNTKNGEGIGDLGLQLSAPSRASRPRQSVAGRPGVGGFILRGRGSGGRRFLGRGVRSSIKRKGPVTARGLSQFGTSQARTGSVNNSSFSARQPSYNQLEVAMDQGSNDSWTDNKDGTASLNQLEESYPKWMLEAFFGRDLLDSMATEKKSKHGGQTPSTPSEDDERANQDPFSQGTLSSQRQQTPMPALEQGPYQAALGQGAQSAHQVSLQEHHLTFPRRSSSSLRKHPPDIGLGGHESWQGSAGSDPLPPNALSLTEEYPNPDALYRTLGMLGDDPAGATSDPPADQEHGQSASVQHCGATRATQAQVNHGSVPPAAASWNQAQSRPQGTDLDILCSTGDILPHVDGHEVEEIFAGIEREMNNREPFSFLDSEIESDVTNGQSQFTHHGQQIPPQAAATAERHHVAFPSAPTSISGYGHDSSNQSYSYGAPSHFNGLTAVSGSQQGLGFPGAQESQPQLRMDGFSNTVVPGQLGFRQDGAFSRRGEFDLDEPPRERRRPPSPRVDPLKQQQKWEEDEKLGAMATISPVLYANLEHVNLKQEYPDWPNRYRAIARLWRKLSVEQRDPYRLKARDNRVRLKDQGKKLIPKSEDKVKVEGQKAPPQNQVPPRSAQDIPQGSQHHEQLSSSPPVLQPAIDNHLLSSVITPATSALITPLTPNTPARSITPVTPGTPGPLTPTTPTTPTLSHSSLLVHSQMSPLQVSMGHLPSSGKTTTSKGKKSKEEKEREKEIRKQKLRIQQEQERQWKILQQRRALEQQRQQQQQQQETAVLRQELRKQQQAKGTKGVDDQKKKRLTKSGKRAVKEPEQTSNQTVSALEITPLGSSLRGDTNSISSSEIREGTLDSRAPVTAASEANNTPTTINDVAHNPPSGNQFERFDGNDGGFLNDQQSHPSGMGSNHQFSSLQHEDVHPLHVESGHQAEGSSHWHPRTSLLDESDKHPQRTLWDQSQDCRPIELEHGKQINSSVSVNRMQHSHDNTRQNSWHCEEPAMMQAQAIPNHTGTENLQEHGRPHETLHVEQPSQVGFSPHDQTVFQDQRQSTWVHRSQPQHPVTPMSHPSVPEQHLGTESVQIAQQGPGSAPVLGVPFSTAQEMALKSQQAQQQPIEQHLNSQQAPVLHWQQELSQVRAQVAAAKEAVQPQSAPPPPPPPPPIPSLPPQPQHPAPQQTFEMAGGWSQQNQVQPPVHSQPMVSLTQPPPPHQIHVSSHSQTPMAQVPFQPPQQLPAQIPAAPQPSASVASQPQDSQLQQQQLDLAQRQQREQLMRAQHQHLIQIQLQQQQVLQQQQQQQQQQNAAIQPTFARGRFNQVITTKDMPEIESEEEHQERLRFLYRQRQVQRQQQMQLQAQLMQQAWLQQQLAAGGGQNVVPPTLLPIDPSNPQIMQQFAQQIRPQMPDMTQQQILVEYQRRMQQRQDLGQQTLQYEKVVQEFQQQQGIQGTGAAHPTGAFVEVPHQRFALRQPTPGVQPGLRPIMPYGIDGQFVGQQQQLYKIQLQQQMIMQQQQKGSLQKNNLPPNPAPGKADMVKCNSEVGNESGSESVPVAPVQKTSSLEQDGEGSQAGKHDTVNEQSRPEEYLVKDEGWSTSETAETKGSSENWEHQPESNALTSGSGRGGCYEDGSETNQINGCKQIPSSLTNASESSNNKALQQREKCNEGPEDTKGSPEGQGNGLLEVAQSSLGSVCHKGPHPVKKEGQLSSAESAHMCSSACGTSLSEKCPDDHTKGSEIESSSSNFKWIGNEMPRQEHENKEGSEKEGRYSPDTDGKGKAVEAFQNHDLKLLSKEHNVGDVNHCPPQPQPLSSQVPPAPSQPQQILFQQQLMGLHQQFIQMQQQRQVLVQQYQQLQQQLQQAGGQDPVLAGQVMNVQHQGQILQQQMLQAWQQMQLIQQQLQLSGVPNQQTIAQQQHPQPQPQPQQQQQLIQHQHLGQQWPNGVVQEQQIGAQSGVYPVRSGAVSIPGMLPSGIPGQMQPSVQSVEETHSKPKRGKSRKKSEGSSTSQPSPFGQPNMGVEWQPPKVKQTKPRQRKSKKPDTKVDDPDLEIKRQLLQQQLYQQLEQRHCLMQQKPGKVVEGGPQPGQSLTQQTSVSFQQHMEQTGPIAHQPQVEPIHPMRPLSHTPELGQAPPPRPDSQMGPPSGPQLPPSSQTPPGYSQSSEPGSFTQLFPTPEHYVQQFSQCQVQQRQPTVEYVAEANNPFSDAFQGLQNKGRGRGGKKRSLPKKPGKPRIKKGMEPPPLSHDLLEQRQQQTEVGMPAQCGEWFTSTPPPTEQQPVKQEQPEGQSQSVVSEHNAPNTPVTLASPITNIEGEMPAVCQNESSHNIETECTAPCPVSNTTQGNDANNVYVHKPTEECGAVGDQNTVSKISPVPVDRDGDDSVAEKEKSASCNGPGLGAPLQKLESMVADIASEEEACKELEKQNEIGRLQLHVDEDESDLDMEKLLFDEPNFEHDLLSPRKSMGDGSQANSVASLECHEDSLISPLLEGEAERRRDRQKFFGEGLSNERVPKESEGMDMLRNGGIELAGESELQKSDVSLHPPSNIPDRNGNAKADQQYVNDAEPVDKTVEQVERQQDKATKSVNSAEEPGGRENTDTVVTSEAGGSVTPTPILPEGVAIHENMNVTGYSSQCMENNSSDAAQVDRSFAATESHPATQLDPLLKNLPKEVSKPYSQPHVSIVAPSAAPVVGHETAINSTKALEYSQRKVSEPAPSTSKPRAITREKSSKVSRQTSRTKSHSHAAEAPLKKKSPAPREEDPIKKHLQDLRRQEYERKKREYEEQQRRKRELQKELRIQKQMIKEQRKRQRIFMTSSRSKQKSEVASEPATVKIASPNSTCRDAKTATPLSLCEPKLILTHPLVHPYGSKPFNGQCVLKGNFGCAKVDGVVDYYSQFPSPELDLVGHPLTPPSSLPPSPGINQHRVDAAGKALVNGDVSPEQRTELMDMNKSYSRNPEGGNVVKRARYMGGHESSIPPSMPTPPLSDSAATTNDRLVDISSSSGKQPTDGCEESNGKEVSNTSSSSSPETVQYIASSSPESDALNRVQTPKFAALLDRESTDSPTFPAVTVKREQVENFLENGLSQSCAKSCYNDSGSMLSNTSELDAFRSSRLDNDDDLDSITVTLTLSPMSEKRVTDTVTSVADLIGCSPPRRSDIVIEPALKPLNPKQYPSPTSGTAPAGDKQSHTYSSSSAAARSQTASGIYQKTPFPSAQFSAVSKAEQSTRKKPEGPYCRHCDVLIIGIGVMRRPDEEEASDKRASTFMKKEDSESADYKIYRVNVEAGDSAGDIFCSEACLKQYFAHFGSECSSPLREPKTEHRTDLRSYDSSVVSVGQTSVGSGNVTTLSGVHSRGGLVAEGILSSSLRKIRSPGWREDEDNDEVKRSKRQRRLRWKRWQQSDMAKGDNKQRHDLTVEEIAELLERLRRDVKASPLPDDTRLCTLCGDAGDGDTNASARLLNLDVDVWVHLNCALWSLEVYETLNGALMNVDAAVRRGIVTRCVVCNKKGATVSCNQKIGLSKIGCTNNFHFSCAITHDCVFFKDKTMLCYEHRPKTLDANDLVLSSYAVFRKVYVNRDEIQQIASMLRHNQETSDKPQTLRVGSLVVRSLGQLLPHQLQSFHTRDAVYPVGFKTIRFYWSMRSVNRRCKYHCVVEELEGTPSFTVRVDEEGLDKPLLFRGKTPRDVWQQILNPIREKRKKAGLVNLFPQYITGEDLFGLSEQFVLRIIESMPGVDQMQGYNMRYGPSPIMELPLAVNPTGSARSEPLLKTHFRSTRARALRSASGLVASSPTAAAGPSNAGNADESSGPYLKQFVYSKAAQYRKLKTEWKTNVFLGRSNIQGLGLFANKDMEAGSMVIEYIGSIIRNEVANRREQIYEKQNRGVYMFRIDSDAVIDATMAGGPARYINHSCMPNCVAEVVTFEKEQKIIIISNRKVEKGEELTYDYKFDFEDEENKIPCLCGAPNCRKWMN